MMAARDDSEITFYEELGVAPDASPQEIRDAFRLFVRLLHPDQQTDPLLRDIAEKQMRKLNRVYAVLSDPESRRAYDEVLDLDVSPPIIVNSSESPDFRQLAARLSWVAAIVVSAGLLFWLASYSTPGTQSRASDPGSTQARTPPVATPPQGKIAVDRNSAATQISQLRADLRAVVAERDDAIRELDKLRGEAENQPAPAFPAGSSSPVGGTQSTGPLTLTELPAASRPPTPAVSAPPRSEHAANRKFAGFWFYAKPPEGQTNKNRSLYLPEYIEATITEDNGLIHGRYRSRFVIADRAISPDVNFTFTGTANGVQCNCQWTGAGGAKGDVTMKLTSENSLRFDWIANDPGNQGLVSGTAILTRRME